MTLKMAADLQTARWLERHTQRLKALKEECQVTAAGGARRARSRRPRGRTRSTEGPCWRTFPLSWDDACLARHPPLPQVELQRYKPQRIPPSLTYKSPTLRYTVQQVATLVEELAQFRPKLGKLVWCCCAGEVAPLLHAAACAPAAAASKQAG